MTRIYIILSLLISIPVFLAAQETTNYTESTPAALERMSMENIWTNDDVNAAGAVLEQTPLYSHIALDYVLGKGFNRPQAGDKKSGIEFTAEGGGTYKKYYMWGSFDYSRIKNYNTCFNSSIADPFRGMPYYLADTNLSEWVHQNFDIKTRLATPKLGKFILGLGLNYHNTIAAKQVDPRTETYCYFIDLQPGVIFEITPSHYLGGVFQFKNYREDAEMTLSNKEIAQHYYQMKGLGNFTSDLGGDYVRRSYNGNLLGGFLQYYYSGDVNILFSGGFSRKVEDVTIPVAEHPKRHGTVIDDKISVSLAANMNIGRFLHSFKGTYTYRSVDGIEYLQSFNNDYENQDWIILWKSVRSSYRTHIAGLQYDFMLKREDEYNWRGGVILSYEKKDDIYYIPEPSNTELISNAGFEAYLKKNFILGSVYRSRLLCEADASYRMNIDGRYNYNGADAGSDIVAGFMQSDLRVQSADYWTVNAGITYSQAFSRTGRSMIFAKLSGGYLKANKKDYMNHDSGYNAKASIGINF